MGEDPKTIFNFGCPSIDLAQKIKNKKIKLHKILSKYNFSNQDNFNLKNIHKYIVVVQHSVTTEYENTKNDVIETIKAISKLNMNCSFY